MNDHAAPTLDQVNAPVPGDFFGRWSRLLGGIAVILALVSATATFLVLTGLTPIVPTQNVVVGALIANGVIVGFLVALIAIELWKLWVARHRGRAAARLHVRVVTLFSVVAALPAILVAIVATITLDRGLDRWFSNRVQAIVGTSLTVAQAYVREHGINLRAEIIAMAADVDRAEPYFQFDRTAFDEFFAEQVQTRNVLVAMMVKGDGTELHRVQVGDAPPVAVPPPEIFEQTPEDAPLLIAPGTSSEVGAVIKLKRFDDTYLYLSRQIDPRVTQYLRLTEANASEFRSLQDRRDGVQIAFGLMYVGIALIVLLAAIWLGIGFANGLVSPIRRLINAAAQVSLGNLLIQVPVDRKEGDLAKLGSTFNEMTAQLRTQRDELLFTNEQLDERRRFTEAVLAGVSAGVLGLDSRGRIDLVNRSALRLLEAEASQFLGNTTAETVPEISTIVDMALDEPHRMHLGQVTIVRRGHERNLTVRVTSEVSEGVVRGFVVTLDDITDLVAAQRTSAWADVA
ncbi:MAG: PAS domain-containing protein, partial [Hyphomicrobiales bacterium]|nr:PAS domain-containing protein [Hyphomicrobiales bacterium]